MCPTPHHVTCPSCGVRWWLLCGETREEFARLSTTDPGDTTTSPVYD